jgi:hypothetical protein
MGLSLFLEPLIVVTLLFGGAWINRVTDSSSSSTPKSQWQGYGPFQEANEAFQLYQTNGEPAKNKKHCLSSLLLPSQESSWRERDLRILGLQLRIWSPDTTVFQNRLLSRLLCKFPFLVECWYWALIYWVSDNLPVHSKVHN